ncbi:DNA-binding LacI/PurR family transcriptional regulator [Microbacterium resistens]|uniref:DNA-binding LacI/PurR family transcriptional regulator n=1 Tax=Microbacterium resistens TaxID=156977 RepID=A0ABU1SD29_9MICO|nr:substrate-binding domain-containing protein [Microbacterium resistens]MDR6867484.1 DNA-binding LacI/PurR family transcriptional regulator [Microbacterium resistens]
MRAHVRSRQQRLIDLVREHGAVSVRALAEQLDVHVVTVRRDLDLMVEAGQLGRRHGAAVWLGPDERTAAEDGVLIGMLVPVRDYYFGEIIRGAREAASGLGMRLMLTLGEYEPADDAVQVQRMLDSEVDGMLLAPAFETGRFQEEAWQRLAASGLPAVVLERRMAPGNPLARYDAVYADHAHGVAEALRHLVESGRRRVAMLARNTAPGARYHEGYLAGLDELGLQAPFPVLPAAGQFMDLEAFASNVRRITGAVREGSLDGLIVQNDESALELLTALIDEGLDIPGELAIIAYDDEIAEFGAIPLSAVAPPKREVGRRAVHLLAARMAERENGTEAETIQHQALLPTLRLRASTP